MSEGRYFIVAVDGGGCRGVIPAMLLRSIGEDLVSRADLFAGTSTGGIIAGGLACGVSIEAITDVYLRPTACTTIFTPYVDGGVKPPSKHRSIWRRIADFFRREERSLLSSGIGSVLEELLHPQYTSAGVRSIVSSFEQTAQPLAALKKHCFLPTFLIDGQSTDGPQWQAGAFHNLGEEAGLGGFSEVSVLDAIMGSAAAPMYFPPHEVGQKLFVDGGVVANNPAVLALAAVMRAGLVGPRGVPLERVSILSLGTGRSESSYPPDPVGFPPPYGILGWMWPKARGHTTPAMPAVDASFEGVAQLNDYQARSLIGEDNYRRAELDFGTASFPMDGCDKVHAADGLVDRTKAFMSTDAWRDVVGWARSRLA